MAAWLAIVIHNLSMWNYTMQVTLHTHNFITFICTNLLYEHEEFVERLS